ncbi:MAG: PRC-barrel domain-containing protein [Rubrobacter sp.]|nr:PRC-barrel domain-containing protein [Rubrobacter sp.]
MHRDDHLRELEERYEGYEVYDNAGEQVGKVDDLFIDETDREEYIGVKMGLFGLSGSTAIPMEIARVNEQERRIEVAASKDHIKDAPHYSDDDDIDLEFEARIRDHFELEGRELSPGRGTYGSYVGATVDAGGALSGATGATPRGGIEDRDLVGRETYQDREDLGGVTGATDAGVAIPMREPSELDAGARRDLGTSAPTGGESGEERITGRGFDEPVEAHPISEPGETDLAGGQRETSIGGPEIGGADERFEAPEREPGIAEPVDVGPTTSGVGPVGTDIPEGVGVTDRDLERDIRTGDQRTPTEPLGPRDEIDNVPLDRTGEGTREEDTRIRVWRRMQREDTV